jgi:hypothetical protein
VNKRIERDGASLLHFSWQVLGRQNHPSAFARLPFPTAPGYTGRPWFMPAVIEVYRLRDRLQGWP